MFQEIPGHFQRLAECVEQLDRHTQTVQNCRIVESAVVNADGVLQAPKEIRIGIFDLFKLLLQHFLRVQNECVMPLDIRPFFRLA